MSQTQLNADSVSLPTKRTTGDTLEARLSSNAYNNILPARYLLKDENGDLIEQQDELFRRVAKNVALAEAVYAPNYTGDITVTPGQVKPDHPRRDELIADVFGDGTDADADVETELTQGNVNKFAYDTIVPELPDEVAEHVEDVKDTFQEGMESLSFMPNSPTLMNAGDELQQLSACFVNSPEDNISDIHQVAKEAAEVFQSGGGQGTHSGNSAPTVTRSGRPAGLRPARLRSCGRSTRCVKQSIAQAGARRGAQMGVMRVSHTGRDRIHPREEQGRVAGEHTAAE